MIGDQAVPFKATAATTRRYRQRTGRDLFADFNAISEAMHSPAGLSALNLQAFEDVAYIMAKQADPDVPDDPDEWLDRFDLLDIYEVLPQIVTLWGASMQTSVESASKKK